METDALTTAAAPEVTMAVSAVSALVFLLPSIPIGIWVAWSDMRFMKIPNKAVLALSAVFLLLGLFVLPWEAFLWRLLQAAIVLLLGFILNIVRALGAGDAKFAAAMATMIAAQDVGLVLVLFAGVLLAAFATHRLFKALPSMRRAFPDWKSWSHPKIPMGLALSGTLLIYLSLGAILGS